MKILFLAKYYQPFDRGGSEWSTRDLACLLIKDGHNVTVVTPNYGAKTEETIDNVNIIRIPFPIKPKNPTKSIAPFWTNNLIWFIYSSLFCLYIVIKKRYKIVHIQNNEFVPAGVIASKILGKKVVATFRDYQLICNLGFCLWKSDKSCSWNKYLNGDLPYFYENYVENKSIIRKLVLVIAVVRARLIQIVVFQLAKHIDYKIAVSKKVKSIFEKNGISNLKVINNAVIINKRLVKTRNRNIIYVGKLSKGKGIDILVQTFSKLLLKKNEISFEIIGSGHLEDEIRQYLKSGDLLSDVKLIGHLSHKEVLNKISKAALVIVPSIWPEPLPRSVIESILSGTPVVASDVGGIREVLKNNTYGLLAKPNKRSLQASIEKGYNNREKFRSNIKNDIKKLRMHYTQDTLKLYEQVYTEALN